MTTGELDEKLWKPNPEGYRLQFKEWVPLKVGSRFDHTTSATDMAQFVITKVEVEGFVFLAELVGVQNGMIPWLL